MRKATQRRSLALCGLLALAAAFPTLFAPPRAAALGLIETDTFYSDATYRHVVGRCVTTSCGGSGMTCTGNTTTEFVKTTFRIC
ncbi:MAG TPA: hypothetical protein VF173_16665 [Thermoanaerobaculia bacterium]|nr:hypothetical protein [Thermoanaerobaculia bacterium]